MISQAIKAQHNKITPTGIGAEYIDKRSIERLPDTAYIIAKQIPPITAVIKINVKNDDNAFLKLEHGNTIKTIKMPKLIFKIIKNSAETAIIGIINAKPAPIIAEIRIFQKTICSFSILQARKRIK